MQAIGSSACWFVVDADGRRSLVDGNTPVAQLVLVSIQRQALVSSAAEPAKSPPPPKTPPEQSPVDPSQVVPKSQWVGR